MKYDEKKQNTATKIRSQKHMFRSREDIFRYPTAAVRTREDMDYISREFEDIFQYIYNNI